MKLWVGLGNPGRQYAGHRHNIGFLAIDRIAADHGFAPWRARFQGLVAEGRLGSTKVMLLKPQTYMNRSGQSVGEAARFFKLGAEDVTVFHDELDLAPGKCRLKQGGGHAGHNGLRSITAHLGAEFARVRLGIGHPGRKELVSAWVLHDFARADADWLDELMRGISEGAPALAAGDGARFLNAIATRMAPARNAARPEKRPEKRPETRSGTGQQATGAGAQEKGGTHHPASNATTDPPDNAEPGSARAHTPPPAQAGGDPRGALQRLVDRFRRG
ncbi:MAG: aminoacyl-tRNA hydrolase [Pararhodobacter sp.]|nr:aminoacyl-tRNA hydrolase [Pararhodobacter sp.]